MAAEHCPPTVSLIESTLGSSRNKVTDRFAGYTNITLVLNEADTGLGELLALTNATSTGFKTSDGGITWKCEKITIEKDELTQ